MVYGDIRSCKWTGYRSKLDSIESVILSRGVDQETGWISCDADGSGATEPVLFAKVMPGITVSATNFATY